MNTAFQALAHNHVHNIKAPFTYTIFKLHSPMILTNNVICYTSLSHSHPSHLSPYPYTACRLAEKIPHIPHVYCKIWKMWHTSLILVTNTWLLCVCKTWKKYTFKTDFNVYQIIQASFPFLKANIYKVTLWSQKDTRWYYKRNWKPNRKGPK